jgi:hypothetical protein
MDGDAKYLKRKVKAGSLDVHPTEKALGELTAQSYIRCFYTFLKGIVSQD